MSKKVASYLTLTNVNQTHFELWLKTLPVRLRGGMYELLWLKARGKKSILWTSKGGFEFIE